jgi:hypothetical protein
VAEISTRRPEWLLDMGALIMERVRRFIEMSLAVAAYVLLAPSAEPSLAGADPNEGSLVVSDWGRVEERLIAETTGGTELDAYMSSPLFRQLLRSENDFLWNTMVAEPDHMLVAVAGFHCISQNRPKDTIAAGLKIIAESKSPASLAYSPIYEYLSRRTPEEWDLPLLNHVLQHGCPSIVNLVVVLHLVPAPIVAAWLQSESVRQAPAISVACAVERVLTDGEKRHLTEKETEGLLEKVAACPGFPRLTYATFSRKHDQRYLSVLRTVLSDDRFSEGEIYIILNHQTKFVLEHLETLREGMPEARVRLIEKLLKRIEDRQ